MASGNSGSEWYKLSHIQQVEAYADGGDKKKSYVLYTSEPYSMDTNIELNRQGRPDETPLSGLAGLFRSGDEDEEDVDNIRDKSDEECMDHNPVST